MVQILTPVHTFHARAAALVMLLPPAWISLGLPTALQEGLASAMLEKATLKLLGVVGLYFHPRYSATCPDHQFL
jgi:hypothetical protein